jgi:hypothetical protein
VKAPQQCIICTLPVLLKLLINSLIKARYTSKIVIQEAKKQVQYLLEQVPGAVIQARYSLILREECFVTKTEDSYNSDVQQANY